MRDGWEIVALGKLISQSKTKVSLLEGKEYPAIGVMMEGRGFVARPPFVGGKTTYSRLTPIKPNQLVLRSITAWEAPIQVTTEEHSGFHVSGVFPVFDINIKLLEPQFLSLICRYEPFWESMRERTVGSVLRRKTLSATALMEIPIQLPPLADQRRIVDLISSVDSYIADLERHLESTKKSRNSVLHELLHAGGDGWKKTNIGKIFHIQQGKTLAIGKLSGGKYPVYGANGIVGHFDDYNFDYTVTGLGCRGSCGTIYYIQEKAFLANNVMAVWQKDSNTVIPRFIPLALENIDLVTTGAISGQVQPQITKQSLEPVPITIPPISEQKRIVDLISSIDDVVNDSERTLENSKYLRSGLSFDLLSGKHEIPTSYDKFMGAA